MDHGRSRMAIKKEFIETKAEHEILIECKGHSSDTNSEKVCLVRRQLTPPPTGVRIEGVSPDGVTY